MSTTTQSVGSAASTTEAVRQRTVLITGGASGIGLACTKAMIGRGWTVAVLDCDASALARVEASLASPSLLAREVDISDERAVEAAVSDLARKMQRIDGLVNCAAIAADIPFFDTSVEYFRKALEVNVLGTFIVSKAVARCMRDQGRGSIVNFASPSGVVGQKGRAAYGASKGAVITLTRVMANDLARFGVRVNGIHPGAVHTPATQVVHTEQTRRAFLSRIPLRRYAEPAEMVGAVLFLLDEEMSGYVTGEFITVDGGFLAVGIMAEN